MVATDLRGRYVGSALGLFWSVLHPLVLITIYTLVFSRVMRARLPGASGTYDYSVYLCAGLLPWTAFQEIVTRSTTVFFEHADLVKQVAFPKTILHGAVVGAAAVNLAIMLLVLLGFLLLIDYPVRWPLVLWPLFIVLQLAFAAGLGLGASVLNVFFRDTAQIVGVLFQFWFWLTPLVYPAAVVPEWFSRWLVLNPLYHFTRIHQDLLLSGRLPGLGETVALSALAVLALSAGLIAFERLKRRIPDEL
jgi:lipopolysaccharide transport system permease protein